jgi:hypothetical protein
MNTNNLVLNLSIANDKECEVIHVLSARKQIHIKVGSRFRLEGPREILVLREPWFHLHRLTFGGFARVSALGKIEIADPMTASAESDAPLCSCAARISIPKYSQTIN